MNSHSNRFVNKSAFLLALLFFSCQSSSFLVRKYLPKSSAASRMLRNKDGLCLVPNSSIAPVETKRSAVRSLPVEIQEANSGSFFSNRNLAEASANHPLAYTNYPDLTGEHTVCFQKLLLYPLISLKDTVEAKHVKKIKSAKRFGRESLIISSAGFLLITLAAVLASETGLVVIFGIIAFYACIISLILAIKCFKAARRNQQKMPVEGKFGLVLSVLGILAPIVLLIIFLAFWNQLYLGLNFQLNFH